MLTTCIGCNIKLKVPDTAIGKKARCPKCSTVWIVESSAPALPPLPETSAPTESEPASQSLAETPNVDGPTTNEAPSSQPVLFRPSFFGDLKVLAQKLYEISDPRACLQALANRFDKRRKHLRQFRAELARLVDATDVAPRRFLPLLSSRFAKWRMDAESQIDGFLKSLPKDDPLNCAISLFGTLDFGRHERAHTKTLAWLLDPSKAEHGFGPTLLKSLLRSLECEFLAQFDFDSVSVEAEKLLDQENRIDVFVEGRFRDEAGIAKKCYLVIEAKVDALEGEEQISRYDEWIDVQLAPSPVIRVFLTPDRRVPISTNMPEAWKAVSFMDLAILFRKELVHLQDKAGYHFLRHYLTGIFKDIYHWKLPIRNPKECVDPYGFLAYVTAVPG
jgi:PD-(D/E)XK nuclease superfamily